MTLNNRTHLDLYSTSPTNGTPFSTCASPRCIYASIWFAYQIGGKTYGISQGCCNHWDCPRCGQIRAKQEYARIVYGIHELSKKHRSLYFQTITCRGLEISREEADSGYLEWTNRLLDSYRQRVKRNGGAWVYVQVTERQKRGHPHSHFLTTFEPADLENGTVEKWTKIAGVLTREEKPVLRSRWLGRAVVRSGLGSQYDISRVRDERAASRYVAKYLFKPTAFSTEWPKNWKRVRYSQSFPQLPELKTDAFVLRTWQDWEKLAREAVVVECADAETFVFAQSKLRDADCVVSWRKKKNTREVLINLDD